jgi:hypothetical protein
MSSHSLQAGGAIPLHLNHGTYFLLSFETPFMPILPDMSFHHNTHFEDGKIDDWY